MTTLKGFLPTSPSGFISSTHIATDHRSGKIIDGFRGIWKEGDLGDGRGKIPLLLTTSKTHALQIFTFHEDSIAADPHIKETFPAPEEIISLPSIKYDKNVKRSSIDCNVNVSSEFGGVEQILSFTLLQNDENSCGYLIAAVVLETNKKQSGKGILGLVAIDLRTGSVIRSVELGAGNLAAVSSSSNILVVTVSQPVPAIHILNSVTFDPLPSSPITQVALNPQTRLPIIAQAGRLLAFVTAEPPRAPGPDALGTIITSSSLRPSTSRPSSTERRRPLSSGNNDTQAAILSSAVEIGGGVARGVWAGIKMGARAANRARNTRLAKSAPSDSSGILVDEDTEDAENESRSLGESSILEDTPMLTSSSSATAESGGEWIKIVDLFPKFAGRSRLRKAKRTYSTTYRDANAARSQSPLSSLDRANIETVAHFRLPPSTSSLPIDPLQPHQPRRLSNNRSQAVTYLSFSPDGSQLFAAPSDGRSFHIFEIRPAGIETVELAGDVKGHVWHLYELKRGYTAANVKEVNWARDGRWIGVGTGKGTVHVFPITPSGGPPTASTHAIERLVNSPQLHPLSVTVEPIARLRPRGSEQDAGHPSSSHDSTFFAQDAPFMFQSYRRHPSSRTTFCQDIPLYRPFTNTFELARVSVTPLERKKSTDERSQTSLRRGSALTEMMKNKAFGEGPDFSTEAVVKAAWNLPEASQDQVWLDNMSGIGQACIYQERTVRSKSLAYAEIRTHHLSPSILPASIYLSRQVEFFSATAIDEYTPLSILDLEARQHKFEFRDEVRAFSPVPEYVKPFDEPLLLALHSVLEEMPITQLPRLPNGAPKSSRWTSTRIPIRTVTSGIGEGVDRVRREYVRAQHTRSKRKNQKEDTTSLGLSFEDSDSISLSHPSLSSSNDSPLSEVLPTTTSSNTEQSEEDEEWGQGWEEEYNKAIEDDTPQELVLGLMDEEEEERRKWEIRRERMKKEYNVK
nr:uncharacterized protein I206_07502 [Kwoniella pini CBS 10737]OCF46649.1 hypothetical protein I206_07502 [Kwoniella pini CBS 10737]